MKDWQIQEAKARFSDLIREATESPQEITHHGKPVAVVMSCEAYASLNAPKESLVTFLRRSPLYGEGIDFERQDDSTRPVDL